MKDEVLEQVVVVDFPEKKKHFLVSFSIPYKQNFAEFENRYCQKFSRGNVKKNN